MSEFTKEIKFVPAFDKRNKDPKKDYGICSVMMYLILKGEAGALVCEVFTGWHLPHVEKNWLMDKVTPTYNPFKVHAGYMGYHSPKPLMEDQAISKEVCDYIGVPCYGDGSFCLGDRVVKALIEKGHDAAWDVMMEFYNNWLLGKR